MLVIKRRPDERVRFFNDTDEPLVIAPGEEIGMMTVIGLHGDYAVRLGFEFHEHVKILRQKPLNQEAQVEHGKVSN